VVDGLEAREVPSVSVSEPVSPAVVTPPAGVEVGEVPPVELALAANAPAPTLEELQKKLADLQGQLAGVERKIAVKEGEIKGVEDSIQTVKTQINALNGLNQQQKLQIDALKKVLDLFQKDLLKRQDELSALKKERDKIEEQIREVKKQIDNLQNPPKKHPTAFEDRGDVLVLDAAATLTDELVAV
jgi:predicted RNase H-like nuclease (RuvC/YqgF family)